MLRKRPQKPDLDEATGAGLSALTFLAEDRARLVRFLDLTGIGPEELRQQAQSPALLAAVLEHMLADESLLLVFTATAGIDPERLAPLAAILHRAGQDGTGG
jgi:hypothetical protein